MRLCKNQESKFDILPILRNKEFFQDSLFSGLQNKLALENDESFPENDFNKFLDQREGDLKNQSVILIDTWANEATSKVISLLPSGSRVFLLGNLSDKSTFSLCATDIFLRYKTIEGFNLLQYIKQDLGMDRLKSLFSQIRDDYDANA